MPGATFLRGDGVDLRTVEEGDLDFLHRWRTDPRVRQRFPTPQLFTRRGIEREYEERFGDPGDEVALLVVPEGEEDPVGFVGLFDIDADHGCAELGAWVAPDHQGQGYATAACEALLDHAFDERRLERVEARATEVNDASRALLDGLGFVEEGRQRAARVTADGSRVDNVTYGLLRGEW